ncbi:helix-turn-helix transcriptional regulator [Yersinia alsatica]|uniref:helix-turn-helix transcriptional regulator n=1 Tax=Yersinia alsatica TaxID=2890317 RepID=UPI00119DBA80|nr:LuxR C-terminal-related transcriptional regulator [Yersinia alsatica]
MNESLYDSLKLLIHFWKLSSEPWGAKDNQSKFIYANDKYKALLALPNKFCVEGRFDGELPAPTAEFQTDFQQHDRKVELLQDRITSIEIHAFDGQTYFQAWFFDKYPLIGKDGVSQGTIFHGRPVDNLLLKNLYKIKIPTSLVFTPPSELFSKREWEVIFYIMQSFTSKEISKKIHLSPRTICNIIQNIYGKINVTSKKQLIEYCYENKINNYIPESFFEATGSFPLMS